MSVAGWAGEGVAMVVSGGASGSGPTTATTWDVILGQGVPLSESLFSQLSSKEVTLDYV